MTNASKRKQIPREQALAMTGAVEAYRLGAQLLRALKQDLEDNPEAPPDLPVVASLGASEAAATGAGGDGAAG